MEPGGLRTPLGPCFDCNHAPTGKKQIFVVNHLKYSGIVQGRSAVMSSLRLRDITLEELRHIDPEDRKCLCRQDLETIIPWRHAAREAVASLVACGALEKDNDDARPEFLEERLVEAFAHPLFFEAWMQGLSVRYKVNEYEVAEVVLSSTFGSQFDRLNQVDLGMSLLIETARPWNRGFDPPSPEVSLNRFYRVVWRDLKSRLEGYVQRSVSHDCQEVLGKIIADEGPICRFLWSLHWAPVAEVGRPYVGIPQLIPYLKNDYIYFSSKWDFGNEAPTDPDRLSYLKELGDDGRDDDARGLPVPEGDAGEAWIYRRLLRGERIKVRGENIQAIRWPDPGHLGELLSRYRELLKRHCLENALEEAISRLSKDQQTYAWAYHILGWAPERITKEFGGSPQNTWGHLNKSWHNIGKNEVDRRGGLDNALRLIEDSGKIHPPDGGGGSSGPDGGERDTPDSERRDSTSMEIRNSHSGKMSIDNHILRAIRAIQGVTGLRTGEWTRDKVPADVYAHWVEVLGPGMIEKLLDLDRDEMYEQFVRELGRDLSPKTQRILRYVESQTGWSPAVRKVHFRRGLEHERVLRAVGGLHESTSLAGIEAFREPFAILYTAVCPSGLTRWRTRIDSGGPAGLKLTSASGHDSWIQDGAVRLGDGEVIVEGTRLPANELGVFVVSATGRYSQEAAEVFVLRRGDEPNTDAGPEALAELGLFVDAWRAMVASPDASPDEVAEFLLLFVFDPMTLAARAVPESTLWDPGVDRCWGPIINALDPFRETLRELFAPKDH
jgi:hypothetical protein